jgi:hypothetical protein
VRLFAVAENEEIHVNFYFDPVTSDFCALNLQAPFPVHNSLI